MRRLKVETFGLTAELDLWTRVVCLQAGEMPPVFSKMSAKGKLSGRSLWRRETFREAELLLNEALLERKLIRKIILGAEVALDVWTREVVIVPADGGSWVGGFKRGRILKAPMSPSLIRDAERTLRWELGI
jgi:hypothetical protein